MIGKVILFFCLLLSQIATAQDVTINFDMEKPKGLASGQGSGFLHSLSGTQPPDRLVDPLKIKFWRGACYLDERLYRRLQRTNAVIQYVLSDGFQHPTQGSCEEQQDIKDRWPHMNPVLWQKHVEKEARRIKANGWKIIWEPWNEPDYWQGNPGDTEQEKFQQFLDAFLVAYRTVKKVDSNAQFAGPSLSAGNWPTARKHLETFLQFCAQNHIEVTNLTWHGFDDIKNTHKWEERIREIRELAANKYASVKVQRIVISEIVAEKYFFSPGDLVMALKYLDDAGADLVGRTCWFNSCWPEDLDGSVVKGRDHLLHPTSLWWANFWYASTLGLRYSGVSSNNGIVATAAAAMDNGEVTILLGFSKAMGPPKPSSVILNLNHLPNSKLARVEQLPGSKRGILDAPIKITHVTISRIAQSTVLTLPKIYPGDVYRVTLKRSRE